MARAEGSCGSVAQESDVSCAVCRTGTGAKKRKSKSMLVRDGMLQGVEEEGEEDGESESGDDEDEEEEMDEDAEELLPAVVNGVRGTNTRRS